MKKSLWTLLAVGWMVTSSATPPAHLVDSLESAYQAEPDARKRVDILLNLKDLNDSSEDELYYSRKLFDEPPSVTDLPSGRRWVRSLRTTSPRPVPGIRSQSLRQTPCRSCR
mgnify:CR=1 FL=1